MTHSAQVHPVRIAALLALLAMFGPFTIDAFFPAFHAVQSALGASAAQMQQTISVYLWAYAVMSLFHGPLSDAHGRRKVILWGVALFTLSSLGCVFSQTIGQLLLWRALQGDCTGAGLIVGRAIVRDLFEGPQAQKVMSLITLFFGVAPALAPVIGGIVFEAAGWHAVFAFLAFYGAMLWLLCLRVLPETHPVALRTPFRPRPLFDTYARIAGDGRFLLLAAATGFNFGAFFLYISSAPAFVQTLLGLGTLGYPWFFVPCIAGMMTGATLSNRLAGKLAPRATVKLAYAIMITAMALNLGYNLWSDSLRLPWAVLPIALNSVGVSLAFPTLSLKMLDRYPLHRGAASSVQAFIWGMMTGAIAGVLSALLSTSGLHLAFGAMALMLLGCGSWLGYATLTPLGAETPREELPHGEPLEPV
jgi:DHA1 family bicyclomycin/chloramphenicol resistance-like MFS transporter